MNAPLNPQLLQKTELLAQIIPGLQAVLPKHAILHANEDTTPYECDGLTAYRQRPLCVVLPETYEQIAAGTCLWWRGARARGSRVGRCRMRWG
jgi:glycolate oxidase